MTDIIFATSRTQLQEVVEESVDRSIRSVLDRRAPRYEKAWLTNREALEFLGVSKAKLQRLRSEGRIPYSKVDGLIYYKHDDLCAFLDAHRR